MKNFNSIGYYVQLMKAKCLENDFTSCLEIKTTKTTSYVWKNVLDCRYFLKEGLMWVLGNGQTINFWYDMA